jgi:hypothetical protein
MISCVLAIVVYCLVKQNLTSTSIRVEQQELKKPEAKEITKRKEKFDLGKVNHYPTLDTQIKKSVTQLSVRSVG